MMRSCICFTVCILALDAVQIQVHPDSASEVAIPIINSFQTDPAAQADLSDSAASFFPREVVNQLHMVTNDLPIFTHGGSDGQCNMTEIQSVLMGMQKNMAKQAAAKKEAPSAEGAASGGGMGGMMGGGMMGGGMMGGGMANATPEVQKACSTPMFGMMGMNWTAMLPCTAAMMGTRPVCAQCFVNTMQDMMGKTMMEMPASCMSKCMAESQKLGKMGPDCGACMLPNMEHMFTCIGVDLKAFEFGGAPSAMAYASSLVPLRTITTLLTLMTLGAAAVF